MWELIDFIVQVIREIVEERNKQAKAAPPRQAFPQDPPYAQPRPNSSKPALLPAIPSLDPPYERSTWRRVLTLLGLILIVIACLAVWIILMEK